MLTETDLIQFTGTENWHRHGSGLVFTDGVKYLADQASAYWLLDAIASYQKNQKITGNSSLKEIQFWKLKVQGNKGTLTCVEDSGRKPVITQIIEFTDFPLKEVEIWVEFGGFPTDQGVQSGYIMLLPSEH